jgi:hypothetical protein
MVLRIVSETRERSESFRYRWELYRALFANAPTCLEENEPDGYDRATGQTGYRTFAGEVVKSHGERLIANFLYLNGVDCVYEQPYEVNGRRIASSAHSQYRPGLLLPRHQRLARAVGAGLQRQAPCRIPRLRAGDGVEAFETTGRFDERVAVYRLFATDWGRRHSDAPE